MGNLPFERTRYNPVQDVTGEEAERNKQQMNTADAARERTQAVPAQGSAGDDDDAKPGPQDGSAKADATPSGIGQSGNAGSGTGGSGAGQSQG